METHIRELSLAIAGIDLQLALQSIEDLKRNLSIQLQAAKDDRQAQQREFQEYMSELRETLDQIRAKHLIQAQLLDLVGKPNAGDKAKKENQRGRGRTEAQAGRISSFRN